jgi:AcrR family transcriptional regulator
MARTRAQDFEEKSLAILASAAEVFAVQGMDKGSMSQVAQHAGVSKALLYHYYPSKDALLFAIMMTHLQELNDAAEKADDAALEPKMRLRALVGAVLETYRGADFEHKVLLNAQLVLNDEQRAEVLKAERQLVRRFSDVIDTIAPNLNSKERPLLTPVTMSLFGMLNWMYMWFKDGGRISREDYADVATNLLLGGMQSVR